MRAFGAQGSGFPTFLVFIMDIGECRTGFLTNMGQCIHLVSKSGTINVTS